MDELDYKIALEIIQLKIAKYIKEFSGKDKEKFIMELKQLIDEKEKIYDLNNEVINKVFKIYLPEIKK